MRPATAWNALLLAGLLCLAAAGSTAAASTTAASTAEPGSAGAPPAPYAEADPDTSGAPAEVAGSPAEPSGAPPETDHAAQLYLSRCAGCHTVGGGELSGPDLEPSTAWPEEDLAKAVERMEKNAGPMTDEQVGMLVDLLKSEAVRQRLAQAREAQVREMAATLEPPSPSRGRALFHGDERFRRGGLPCSACHRAGAAGGTLGADLTDAAERLGEAALLSAAETPGFPLMKAAYADHPVSRQEAVHVTAYLQDLEPPAPGVGGVPAPLRPAPVGWWGAAGAAVLLLALPLLYRGRVRGVRASLVREATRR